MKKAKRLHEDPLGKRQDVRYGMFDRPIPPQGSEPSQVVPLSASSQTSTQLTTLKQPVEDPDFVPVGKKQMELSVLELAKLMPDEISQKFYKRVHQLAIDLLDGNSLEKQIHTTGEQLMNLESKNLSKLSKIIEAAVKAAKNKTQLKESVFKNPLESSTSLGYLLYDSLENDKVAGKALLKSDCISIATALFKNKGFRTTVKEKNDKSVIANAIMSVIKTLPEYEEDIKPALKKQDVVISWLDKVTSTISEYVRKSDYIPGEDWDDIGEKEKNKREKDVLYMDSKLMDWASDFGFAGPSGMRQYMIAVREKIKKVSQLKDADINDFVIDIVDEYVMLLKDAKVLDQEELDELTKNPDHVAELPSFRIFAADYFFAPAIRHFQKKYQNETNNLFASLNMPKSLHTTIYNMLWSGEIFLKKIKTKFDKTVQDGEMTKEQGDDLYRKLFSEPTMYFEKLKNKFETVGDDFITVAKALYSKKNKRGLIDLIVSDVDNKHSFSQTLNPNVGD